MIRNLAANLAALKRHAFDSVFKHSPFGMTIVDARGGGKLLDANPALAGMLGYDQDLMRKMSFTDFTHPADVSTNMRLYRDTLAGKRDSYFMEKRYVRSDGQILWISLAGSVVRNVAGEPEFIVGIQEDITRFKSALEEKGQAETLSGILPMCSYCKRIRDDRGAWHRVEKYVSDRTPVTFSHGICPHCSPPRR